MGAMESIALAVILPPLRVVLISVGLWLIDLGLRRVRIVSAPKPQRGAVKEIPRRPKAEAVSMQTCEASYPVTSTMSSGTVRSVHQAIQQ